jgi:hypothetical protein
VSVTISISTKGCSLPFYTMLLMIQEMREGDEKERRMERGGKGFDFYFTAPNFL